MDKYGDNDEDMRKAGIEYASNQIRDLIDNGVDGIHLLTMNRPKSTREILTNIGLLNSFKGYIHINYLVYALSCISFSVSPQFPLNP